MLQLGWGWRWRRGIMVLEFLPHPSVAMSGFGVKLPAVAASGSYDSVGSSVLLDLLIWGAFGLCGRSTRRWRRPRGVEFPSSSPVFVAASFPPAALQGL